MTQEVRAASSRECAHMHHHRRWVHATEPSRSLHAALPTHAAPHRIPSMQRPLSARLHACTIDVMPLSRLAWSIPATGPAPAPYRPGYRPGACSGYRPGPCSVSIYCCIMQIRRKSVACPHHLSSASRLARLPPVPPAASVACPRRLSSVSLPYHVAATRRRIELLYRCRTMSPQRAAVSSRGISAVTCSRNAPPYHTAATLPPFRASVSLLFHAAASLPYHAAATP